MVLLQIMLFCFLTNPLGARYVPSFLQHEGRNRQMKVQVDDNSAMFGGNQKKAAFSYLDRYGYKSQFCSSECGKKERKTMIEEFQKFAGLKVTGEINKETIDQMQMPRCGKSDKNFTIDATAGLKRKRRYNPQGSKWSKVIDRNEPLT